MKEFYHYTLESQIDNIMKNGMSANHPRFTTNIYYNADEAGQAVGVMPHNINCVLLFRDDGQFKLFNEPTVPRRGRFIIGEGASQYQHPGKPKPIAKRGITQRNWAKI